MLFGLNPPMAPRHADTILISLCLGGGTVPMRIPRRDDEPRQGGTACHAAAVMPKKRKA